MNLDIQRLRQLLPKYNLAGPRYTSYPTAPVWAGAVGAAEYRDALDSIEPDATALSIYVHVPFCKSLCHFCACNRVITKKTEPPARYLDVLEREIAEVRRCLRGNPTVGQIHLGGGTPTHLTPEQLVRLHTAISTAAPVEQSAELSIEVDPRVTTPEHIAALEECGFNRISMGVQDFDKKVQDAVHRTESQEQVADLMERSRAAGFTGINFDLIYGLPFQTEDSVRRTLEVVVGLRPDRIALYSYAHVTWVAKQQRGFKQADLPSGDLKLRIMLLSIEYLLDAGYEYIGMDHFALPDDELAQATREGTLRRNFMGYTTAPGDRLLAFGPSAIGQLDNCYVQSHRELKSWEEGVLSEGVATLRGHVLSDEDYRRRWTINRIMCRGAVSAGDFEDTFGESFHEHFASEIESLSTLEEDGLVVTQAGEGFVVTDEGRLLLRNIAMVFDAYLPEQQRAGGRLFSQTV